MPIIRVVYVRFQQSVVSPSDSTTMAMARDVQSAMRPHIGQKHPDCMCPHQWCVSSNIATVRSHRLIFQQNFHFCSMLATIVLHLQLARFDSIIMAAGRSYYRRVSLAIRCPNDQRLVHSLHCHKCLKK